MGSEMCIRDSPTAVGFGLLEVEKSTGTVSPASSGTAGNLDVVYNFTVTNTGSVDLANLSLVDDWATQFGGNFEGIVGNVTVTNVDATTVPGANGTYGGGAMENILNGTGLLESGQSFTVSVTVEIDPDADPDALVNGALVNTATCLLYTSPSPRDS